MCAGIAGITKYYFTKDKEKQLEFNKQYHNFIKHYQNINNFKDVNSWVINRVD